MPTPRPQLSHQVLEQAAQWFAVLQGQPGPQEHAAWRAWLEAAPEHRQAWNRVEAISSQFARLPQPAAAHRALREGTKRRQFLGIAALFGGGALLATAGRGLPWQAWAADRSTAVGEIRQVPLASGGQLWLNTQSAADIRGTQVRLYRGELLLESSIPLRIETADGPLAMLGRRVGVRQYPSHSEVMAYEGPISPAARGATLVGGRRGELRQGVLTDVGPVHPGAQAWSRGIIQADSLPLGDFLGELSRYLNGYLHCDPEVARLPLVGAFPIAQPDRIFQALEKALPVRVHRPLPWWVSVQPREDVRA